VGPAADRPTAEVYPLSVVIAALVAGLVAGYGIAIPVGAIGTYLVALTARTSLKIGACAALGIATADGLYALIATVGGSAIAPLIAPITVPLNWISVLVLLALAVHGARTAVTQYRRLQSTNRQAETPLNAPRAYFALLGMTMLNPITILYFTALVLGGQDTSTPTPLEQSIFILAAFIASSSWQLLLASGGALLGRILTSPRGRLLTALTSSTLITALALHLLLTAL
jgi:arginine exporter protein ArgO